MTAPTVFNVLAVAGIPRVRITFSEPMAGNVTDAANYSMEGIDGPIAISSVELMLADEVRLHLIDAEPWETKSDRPKAPTGRP